MWQLKIVRFNESIFILYDFSIVAVPMSIFFVQNYDKMFDVVNAPTILEGIDGFNLKYC